MWKSTSELGYFTSNGNIIASMARARRPKFDFHTAQSFDQPYHRNLLYVVRIVKLLGRPELILGTEPMRDRADGDDARPVI